MAITANIKRGAQTYNSLHAGSIDSVVVATSDQYEQPNFRYVISVNMTHHYDEETNLEFYVQPNPYGKGVFNLRQLFMEHKHVVTVPQLDPSNPFIFYQTDAEIRASLLGFEASIRVLEGWDVGGVFTLNPNGEEPIRIDLHIKHGLRNNLTPAITRVDANSVAYTDVLPNTFYDRVRHRLPANLSSGYTYLVGTLGDQGTLAFDGDDGTYNTPNGTDVFLVQYDFYDVDGVLLGTKYSDEITPIAGGQYLAPAYPSNVAYFVGWYADTAFYSFKIMMQGLTTELSTTYLMVIEDNNCRYDNVRVAWIGENGGLEYFNFPLKNERTYSMERKQYMKPYGNYGNVGAGVSETTAGDFGPDLRDVRNIVNREATVNTVLDISSDWLTETEFNYLKGLLIAEHVYILTNLNGEFKTVVIDDKNYLERRERNTKKYNLKLQLRYGQIYQAIDYQLLPPPPVPCELLPAIHHQGASEITNISPVVGEFPIIYQGVDWGTNGGGLYVPRFGNISLQASEAGGLITGQTYKVEITLSQTIPGVIGFTFGRLITSYSSAPVTVIDGSITTTQTFYLVWNPNNQSGGTGIFGCLYKAGLPTGSGYNGTITINVFSGDC
jgi:hypothetical protein